MTHNEAEHVAIQFNDCINSADLEGLASLMTDDHTFIDSENGVTHLKKVMIENWRKFFELCPGYKNTFELVRADGDTVIIRGFAYWSEKQPHDPVIWTAVIADGKVREWRIYHDTAENRTIFHLEE